jgi:hypothetical protein
MSKTDCREIRRALDEIRLGARSSVATMQHLQTCVDCQNFHEKQTKLRQIVGSLGMVEAPADFDLQLRRRLANERSASAYRFPLGLWPVGMRAVTVGAAVILMFAAFLLVRHVFTPQLPDSRLAQENNRKEEQPAPKTTVALDSQPQEIRTTAPGNVAQEQSGQRQRGAIRVAGLRPRQSLATKDSASLPAPVFGRNQSFEAAPFTINASQEFLKLSLDDGSGVARTISVPRVTFGSQRVLTTNNVSNQFAPRGIW